MWHFLSKVFLSNHNCFVIKDWKIRQILSFRCWQTSILMCPDPHSCLGFTISLHFASIHIHAYLPFASTSAAFLLLFSPFPTLPGLFVILPQPWNSTHFQHTTGVCVCVCKIWHHTKEVLGEKKEIKELHKVVARWAGIPSLWGRKGRTFCFSKLPIK